MATAKLSNRKSSQLRNLADGAAERKPAPHVRIPGFRTGIGIMTRVASSQKMDHHPHWSNSWNKVTVDLCTTAPAA